MQKSFILVRHIYWIFRLLPGGRLGCTRDSVKWHPYPLEFSLWSNAITHPHCHCSPRPPHARARSPRLVKPRHGWLGLAWYGMAWHIFAKKSDGGRLGCTRASRYFHNEVRWYLPTQNLKIQFGTFCQILAAPPSGSREGFRRKFRRGMLRGGRLGCTRASVKWHLWPYPLEFS